MTRWPFFAALASPEPDVIGLTTIFGNVTTDEAARNATPLAEAKINNDPEAADLVFGATWPVTMVGLDVTHQVAYLLDPEAFDVEDWPLRVETESFSRGKTWPNMGNTDETVPEAWRGRSAVTVCTGVDGQRVAALVEERLTAGLVSPPAPQ